MKILTSLLFLTYAFLGSTQPIENNSSLELSEIMKGNSFIGHQPENIRWSLDGSNILFDWNPNDLPGNTHYAYSLNSGKYDSLTPEFYKTGTEYVGGNIYPIEVYSTQGNLFRYDRKKKETLTILKSTSAAFNVQRIPEMNCAFFQQGNGLYCYDIETKAIRQLVEIKKKEKSAPEEKSFLAKEELTLFQYRRDQERSSSWHDAQNERWDVSVPAVEYSSGSANNIQIDGTGNYVTFRINHEPSEINTHVEHHITETGYTMVKTARGKVSSEDPSHQLGIYDLVNDTTYYADFSTLPDIRKKPAYLKIYGDADALYTEDRKIIMHELIYSPDGKSNIVDIRSYDNKDRWIAQITLSTGKVTVVNHQHDEAWIGGPGISSWNMASGTLGWIDNQTFYYQSEATGYSHLYSKNLATGLEKQLTSGNWEVHNVVLSSKKDRFYITSNQSHPGNREFYHLIIASGELIPILTMTGNHEVSLSPDEKMLAVRYSSKTIPWELYTAPNEKNAKLRRITTSTTAQFDAYAWYDPKVIQFKASDGKQLHARVYEPKSGQENGAAVIFVHGAGYLQNAHNYWSDYYREYMFHNLLRDNGYTVLDIDYRASEGYGRDHRTAIYRHMGGADLSDQLDGRAYLINQMGIDSTRIGMYGGSYGGFITLMALLTEPGKFKCGAALRSVTDWNHYNHEYTSNILNYPTTDPDAYKRSSPIYFAENLEDRLIMLHGMVDDNVQFQDVVRLSQRFIELGKDNWELAVYPVEAHGFRKSYSWADEYRRIYSLFYQELLKH